MKRDAGACDLRKKGGLWHGWTGGVVGHVVEELNVPSLTRGLDPGCGKLLKDAQPQLTKHPQPMGECLQESELWKGVIDLSQ